MLKARHAAAAAAGIIGAEAIGGLRPLQDDSGLEVDATWRSAGGIFCSIPGRARTMRRITQNCWLLWRAFPPSSAGARYRCALVLRVSYADRRL